MQNISRILFLVFTGLIFCFSDAMAAKLDLASKALAKYQISDEKLPPWRTSIYEKKNYKGLELGAQKLLADKSRQSFNRLERFYSELGRIDVSPDTAAQKAVLDEWVASSPNSQVPLIVRGAFEINWAWAVRTTVPAKDVPPAAWAPFNERLRAAKKDLEQAGHVQPLDPNSWSRLIKVAYGLGLPRTDMENYFQKAIAIDPGNDRAYLNKLEYLGPQWFGSEKDELQFAPEIKQHMDQNPALGWVWTEALTRQVAGSTTNKIALIDAATVQALETFCQETVQREPDKLVNPINCALVEYRLKNTDAAIKEFDFVGNRWASASLWPSLENYNESRAWSYRSKALAYMKDHNAQAAETWYKKSIDLDYATAMTELGRLYLKGDTGVPIDLPKALELFHRAEDLGDVHAINELGVVYANGQGVKKSYTEALHYYERAAEMGYDVAENNLGWYYLKGYGVTLDYARALEWFNKAAQQGNKKAMSNLATMYEKGLGIPADPVKAAAFRHAANSAAKE